MVTTPSSSSIFYRQLEAIGGAPPVKERPPAPAAPPKPPLPPRLHPPLRHLYRPRRQHHHRVRPSSPPPPPPPRVSSLNRCPASLPPPLAYPLTSSTLTFGESPYHAIHNSAAVALSFSPSSSSHALPTLPTPVPSPLSRIPLSLSTHIPSPFSAVLPHASRSLYEGPPTPKPVSRRVESQITQHRAQADELRAFTPASDAELWAKMQGLSRLSGRAGATTAAQRRALEAEGVDDEDEDRDWTRRELCWLTGRCLELAMGWGKLVNMDRKGDGDGGRGREGEDGGDEGWEIFQKEGEDGEDEIEDGQTKEENSDMSSHSDDLEVIIEEREMKRMHMMM